VSCDVTRIALGAYVLDALDSGERAEVDAHLRTCAECRVEVAELATLPPLLSRLSLQDLGESVPTVAAPDALFDKVVASVRDESEDSRVTRLRRRPARALLAAAAAVVLLVGGIVTTVELTGSSGSTATVQSATGVQGDVRMRVTLASQATGTALRVDVSGLPEDEHCWLVAVADDGTRDSVGRWVATYAGEAQVTGSTSIPASHLSRLILLGGDDKQLVSVPV
jgi:anti-sigma factor RsiW